MGELKNLAEKMERCRQEVDRTALERVRGEMLFRIHNEGKASGGDLIGPYRSAQYIKRRLLKGLRVDTKDLQFEGNLLRSLVVDTTPDNVPALGFNARIYKIIARAQEDQVQKTIYTPSEGEIRNGLTEYIESWKKCIGAIE